MKLVDKKTMMELPPGTMFMRLEQQWYFENPAIKGDSLHESNDFWMVDFCRPEDSFLPTMEELADGTIDSAPMNTIVSREALYSDDTRYLVWEPEDLNLLMGMIGRTITAGATDEARHDLAHWRYRVGALEREVQWAGETLQRLQGFIAELEMPSAEPRDPDQQLARDRSLENFRKDAANLAEAVNTGCYLLEEARWKVQTLMVELLGDRTSV